MNEIKDLTVVITIYKVKDYLSKCLNSVKKQTIRNFEVYMVVGDDDADCIKICTEYCELDERFKLVVSEPRGLSDARNVGIKHCRTQYVTFLDGDDYLDEYAFEKLMDLINRSHAEIAIGNYAVEKNNKIIVNNCSVKSKDMCGNEAIDHFLTGHGIEFVVAWGKVYKTSLFKDNNINYPVGKLHEDNLTTYKLYYSANNVSWINDVVYYYVDRIDSLSSNRNIDKEMSVYEGIDELREYLLDRKELCDAVDCYEISTLVNILIKSIIANDKQIEKIMSEEIYNKHYWHNSRIRIRMKIFCFAITRSSLLRRFLRLLKR